jgi:hypothetical protein
MNDYLITCVNHDGDGDNTRFYVVRQCPSISDAIERLRESPRQVFLHEIVKVELMTEQVSLICSNRYGR